MRRLSRSVLTLSVSALVASSLVSCSAKAPDPAPAAEALASALSSGDFSQVPLLATDAAEAKEALEHAYGPMKKMPHSHSIGQVAADEDKGEGPPTATATVHTVWDVDATDQDLAYDTTATFEYDDAAEQWKLRFDTELLAPDLSDGEYLAAVGTAAERGAIIGAGGEKLVKPRPVVRIGIDKTRAESDQWENSARKLAKLVEIDADTYAQKVLAAGDKAWVQAIVLRDDDKREATDAKVHAIAGAVATKDELPLAPTRDFARDILGTVGQATAELIEKSDGRLAAGDQTGISGLQYSYDKTLAGTKGITISRYDAKHQKQEELFSKEPVAGEDLEITLDAKIQGVAEKLVAKTDSTSALVVLRPSDGAILSAASGPADNPQNTALTSRYAPGSTFKIVSALAMLREGKTPKSTVQCPATLSVDGREFKNFDGYPSAQLGSIPLSEAIAQSCNTVFLAAGEHVGGKQLAEAAAALGLTGEDGTGAGAFLGEVPSDSTGTERAANMIGQGVVQASPLGMATVAASVAAAHTVQPVLVTSPEPKKPAAATSELSAEEAKDLSSMMAQVVDHGTLTLLKDVPGPKVIGKSGTAEYDSERNAHAWTIAVQGDLAVAAFVEDGEGGSHTAGPLVRDLLTAINN